jgi:ferrous iron transport protein B
MRTVAEVIRGEVINKPHRITGSPEIRQAVGQLVPMLETAYPGLPNARWVAMRLLDGDYRVRQALESGEFLHLAGLGSAPREAVPA